MSRVHEALARAAAEAGSTDTDPAVVRTEGTDQAFRSAWQFEESDASRTISARQPQAPATVPGPAGQAGPVPFGPAAEPRTARTGGPRLQETGPPAAVRLESLLALDWPQPFAPGVAEKLVVTKGANPRGVEQYRRLAAALETMRLERGTRVVVVTSARGGEGKTLTAANLALILSEADGRRVLLLDAHTRGPALHQIFQVSAGRGVAAGLAGAVELTRRLVLLPGGRPVADPGQADTAEPMRAVLTEARNSFDWVVVDAAPVVHLADVKTILDLADVALLVADGRTTDPDALREAVDLLGRDRIAGVVLNRAPEAAVRQPAEAR